MMLMVFSQSPASYNYTTYSTYTNVFNEKSDLLGISCGVPQGSVLCPLLFLIYINDIIYSISNGNFILDADDTNIFLIDCTREKSTKKQMNY